MELTLEQIAQFIKDDRIRSKAKLFRDLYAPSLIKKLEENVSLDSRHHYSWKEYIESLLSSYVQNLETDNEKFFKVVRWFMSNEYGRGYEEGHKAGFLLGVYHCQNKDGKDLIPPIDWDITYLERFFTEQEKFDMDQDEVTGISNPTSSRLL